MDVIDIWQQWGKGRGRGPAMVLCGNLVSVYKHKEAVTLKKKWFLGTRTAEKAF